MRKNGHNVAAFTLIELIMVMLIITIAVAVLGPNMRNFTYGRKADDAAQRIMAMARYAQTQAISEGRNYRLNVDSQGTWITAQSGAQWVTPTTEFGTKLTVTTDSLKLDTDIAKQQDGQYVTFNPNGIVTFGATGPAAQAAGSSSSSAPPADSATITLTDPLGRKITIACASETDIFRVLPAGEAAK